MSHEIRTPMNAVVGMAHLLGDSPLNPQQRQFVEVVRGSAESLLIIINDILDFSKIEAGRLSLEHHDFDLAELVTSVMNTTALPGHEKGLELSCTIDPTVPHRLAGDSGRLRQILVNLMGNAIKFTAAGSVSLQVEPDVIEEFRVVLRFAIVDTGAGISAASRDGLFNAFEQADASSTRRYGGTGLGLAISKRLTALLGGEIGVETEPGQGSTFWFTAPLQKSTSVDHTRASSKSPAVIVPDDNRPPDRIRILVAEDNETNQLVALKMLENLGYSADVVANGAQALQALSDAHYDLVLMDVQMPQVDGIEATRSIRAPDSPVRHRHIPIIALTAHAMKGDEDVCLVAGMNDYLTKPVHPEDLRRAIHRQLLGQTASEAAVVPEESAGEPEPPRDSVLDRAGLLERLGQDAELVEEVLSAFFKDAPVKLQGLETALAAGDAREAKRLAHTLKGAAANVGAQALQRIARDAELAATAGELDRVSQLLEPLRRAWKQIEQAWAAQPNPKRTSGS